MGSKEWGANDGRARNVTWSDFAGPICRGGRAVGEEVVAAGRKASLFQASLPHVFSPAHNRP